MIAKDVKILNDNGTERVGFREKEGFSKRGYYQVRYGSVASFAVKTANPRNLRRKDACGSGKRIDKLFF